ncbi:MAG: hypothetical protein WCC60_03555 [Ilumatobacteraceae bacterium]
MGRRPVWISKCHFDDPADASCGWCVEGRSDRTFQVPPPESLLIVYDQDALPVELWRVGELTFIDPEFDGHWTTFAQTTMAELLTTSAAVGVRGIDFHDQAVVIIPAYSGYLGEPGQLNDRQVEDLFDYLGWSQSVRD